MAEQCITINYVFKVKFVLRIIPLTFDYQGTHFDPHTIACNYYLHLPISPHKTCNSLLHHTEEGVNWAVRLVQM